MGGGLPRPLSCWECALSTASQAPAQGRPGAEPRGPWGLTLDLRLVLHQMPLRGADQDVTHVGQAGGGGAGSFPPVSPGNVSVPFLCCEAAPYPVQGACSLCGKAATWEWASSRGLVPPLAPLARLGVAVGARKQQPFFGCGGGGPLPAGVTEPRAGRISAPGLGEGVAPQAHAQWAGPSSCAAPISRGWAVRPPAPLGVPQAPGGELRHEGPLHLRQGQVPDPRLQMQSVRQAGVRGPGG